MAAEDPSIVTIDEQARRRFEAAWQERRPQAIEEFLPPPDRPNFLATLEEFVHIELELVWKTWGESSGKGEERRDRPSAVEAYLARFPRLQQPGIVRRLVEQEYRVRHRYGDRPPSSGYGDRFPDLVDISQELEKTLPTLEATADQFPQIPGYQILGFLGRGGMGVVYKARQISLNRIVALKMLLTEGYASEKELMRFHTEAEAVARLQHPHVVQIHEVGQSINRPYLALEFVEGGTLARRLAATPQPARSSAQFVEALARAMHAAHQRGIIHRDLKPANILLQNADCGVQQEAGQPAISNLQSAIPKIADFGLAKLLDSEKGQTTTGTPMGTPSYMAPEQALGTTSQIGPATDIYALGAILYELLTGRPPFQGETPLSTLEEVRSQEPVPPSRLHPKTPRDLETICLKCLHKEPRKRYGSAEDLANDLRSFLAGESIRARPTAAWERGVKWARRRPALAALLGVSGGAALTVSIVIFVAHHRLQQQFQEVQQQRGQALANFRKARDAVDRLTDLAEKRLPEVPETELLRRELLMDVVKFYEDFAQEKTNDPDILCETGAAFRRLGQIYENLSELPRAEQSYQRAFEIQEQLLTQFPKLAAAPRELAMNIVRLGSTHAAAGRYKEAEQRYRQALTLQERLLAESPDDRDYRGELAVTHNLLGVMFTHQNRLPEAEEAFRNSLELMERLATRFPSDPRYRTHLGLARGNIGAILEKTGQLAEAEKAFRQNLAMYEDLAANYPTVADHRFKICLALQGLAAIWAQTDRAREAEQALRRTWDLRIQLAKDFPNMPLAQSRLADSLHPLAELVAKRGDRFEARHLLEMAVSHRQNASKMAPQDRNYVELLRQDYDALTNLLIQMEEHAAAKIAAEAAQVAADIPALFPKVPEELVAAAQLLARCVQLVEKDAGLAEDKRKEFVDAYSNQALQLLREAIRQDYQSHDHLKDPAFGSLRKHPDFQKLLSELAAGTTTEAK